jgi:hypothetical protein
MEPTPKAEVREARASEGKAMSLRRKYVNCVACWRQNLAENQRCSYCFTPLPQPDSLLPPIGLILGCVGISVGAFVALWLLIRLLKWMLDTSPF